MKYVGFYFLIGVLISVGILITALLKHRAEVRGMDWINAISLTVIGIILWPVILMRLAKPNEWLREYVRPNYNSGAARALQKARQKASLEPPYCSSVACFDVSKFPDSQGAQGLFYFQAEALEHGLSALVERSPYLMNDDEGGLLLWLKNRNREDAKPVAIPEFWGRVIHTVDTLARTGIGTVHCRACNRDYTTRQLTSVDDAVPAGWNHNELRCTSGHLLLRRRRIHILSPRSDDVIKPHLPTISGPGTKQAMMALVRQCEGGRVIYRNKRVESWLCVVNGLTINETGFYVGLTPIRRVDTAMWQHYPPGEAFEAGGPWDMVPGFKGRKHAIVCTGYVDWCITFDQAKVAEVMAMAEAPKLAYGDLMTVLRELERDAGVV